MPSDRVSDLIGVSFEAVRVDDVPKLSYIVQTLEPFLGEFIKLTIGFDGTVMDRTSLDVKKAVPLAAHEEHYSHVSLKSVVNGRIEFEDLPYRPTPYPRINISADVYRHPSGKVWALASYNSHILIFYKNDQTAWKMVCQKTDFSKAKVDRVEEKKKKGYTFVGSREFNPMDRDFKN